MRFAVRTYRTAAVNNQTAGAPRVCVCNVCAEYELRHQSHIYPHTTQPATDHMTDQIESDDGHAAAVTPTHHRCWRCLRATQPHGRDARLVPYFLDPPNPPFILFFIFYKPT
jgi:hypothetical protein